MDAKREGSVMNGIGLNEIAIIGILTIIMIVTTRSDEK